MREDLGLRPTQRAVATGMMVALALLAAALWAAQVDFASAPERNAVPLDVLAVLSKLLSVVLLLHLARKLASRSFMLIALLLGAMAAGSLLVDAAWFGDVLDVFSDPLERVLPFSSGFIELAVLFLALAVIAGGLVLASWRAARPAEKPALVVLIALLFVLGLFVGPVNAIASTGINREWLFAEDFGQVVSMALVTGYLAALVVAVAEQSGRLTQAPNVEGDKWDTQRT